MGPALAWRKVHPDGVVHEPKLPGDVGFDLETVEDVSIAPGYLSYVKLGVAFSIPSGHWLWLTGRSSLARKLGLGCVPGVIDQGYQGEMEAGLYSVAPARGWVHIAKGTRVAQVIVMGPAWVPSLRQVGEFEPTERGANGWGSTG